MICLQLNVILEHQVKFFRQVVLDQRILRHIQTSFRLNSIDLVKLQFRMHIVQCSKMMRATYIESPLNLHIVTISNSGYLETFALDSDLTRPQCSESQSEIIPNSLLMLSMSADLEDLRIVAVLNPDFFLNSNLNKTVLNCGYNFFQNCSYRACRQIWKTFKFL